MPHFEVVGFQPTPRSKGRGRRARRAHSPDASPTFLDASSVAAAAASHSAGARSLNETLRALPTDEMIDAAQTLPQLRAYEHLLLRVKGSLEESLEGLMLKYKRVRAKMYREHKHAVIAEDNAALQRFQAGCAKPKEVWQQSKEELNKQAACLQQQAAEVDDSDLGRLMRRHLLTPPPAVEPAACVAFRQVSLAQLRPAERACLAAVGEARWTADGLVDNNTSASGGGCGRRWRGTADVRCLLANKALLFFGNSVVRRQMYTVLDLLAGPRAHRQLHNFTDVTVPDVKEQPALLGRSWIWDQDNLTRSYHGAQLFTVDLATGEHRFHMPHKELCGLSDSFSVFSPGRMRQWREPGTGGGSEPIDADWRTSKWAGREWKPLVSFSISWPEEPRRKVDACAPRRLSWAGAVRDGHLRAGGEASAEARRRKEGFAERLTRRILRDVQAFFSPAMGYKGSQEWVGNISVQLEEPPPFQPKLSRGRRRVVPPNVWIFFPTYHGERERFNGFCEDKPCECTSPPVLASCHRHPECRGKHVCQLPRRGSEQFVDHARRFAASLRAKGRLLGYELAKVKVTPFYDDCWERRGRCQGYRPCREPVDAAWTCRATAMYCAAQPWRDALAQAKAWIPRGHPSTTLLYLFDGQTTELLDETFRTWGPHTVGFGADALIFGPQFGSFHGATAWRQTLGGIRSALSAADSCLGRRTLQIFRSPAFNFDPVNTPRQQAVFSTYMRPLVEEAGMVYIDNYPATYDAVFQNTPYAVKFAKNSAFHYLNAGRYLMAQLLLHALSILAPKELA
ncbi:hypothetical protein AB1Y20_020764 [Prymnesium parvum]|uniref:Uncharacterized protein n=1 Tax=Prymnesium parvum TaxID=97485 RepID=A0AB34JYC1_PRYPA